MRKVAGNMQYSETDKRSKIIVRTSIIGITANVLLAAFKAVIWVLSHSIAITLDAVNNLSDALSSVITIIGTKLAGRESDKKHPFGYGRIWRDLTNYRSRLILKRDTLELNSSVKDKSTAYCVVHSRVILIHMKLQKELIALSAALQLWLRYQYHD